MVKFGPSGNCKTFYEAGYKSTVQAAQWLHSIGLDAYEYSFGRGILLGDETAKTIGEEMKKYGISVSVHAPYYINFATITEEQNAKNHMYIFKSLEKLKLLQGNRLIVHVASRGKMERSEAVELTRKRLVELAKMVEGFDGYLCLETMGKENQIGTYQEIIDFCTLSPKFIPTFDFGHINSLMQGGLKTEDDFKKVFDYSIEKLGRGKTEICHIHFSKIEYGSKGEIRHLTLEDDVYGPEFEPLARVIKEYNLKPVIICESKEIMASDALKLKEIYNSI